MAKDDKRPTLTLPKPKADAAPATSSTPTPESGVPEYEDRKKEWKDDASVKEEIAEMYSLITSGYDDKADQTRTIEEAYDIYNCKLNENQMYEGDSKAYLPIVRDAIEARVTRYSNSIFPQSGRYSDVISADAAVPYETMALLDHYVEQCGLRDTVVPSLIRSGDVTGQYSLFLSWLSRTRCTIKKVKEPTLEGEGGAISGVGEVENIAYEEVEDGRPDVSVLDARDLLILPTSVDAVEDADLVAIALRMSKSKIRDMIASGEFDKDAGEELLENMSADREQQANPDKKAANAAGIKSDSKGNKTALVYMVWTKLKLGKERRWCVAYIAGPERILSCKRNPYWSDRIPVITQASLKVSGSIWGRSRVEPVAALQYAANDAFNMGQDSIKYSLCPIIIVDPEKFAKVSSVVLTMGAIWQGELDGIRIEQFPSRWQEAEAIVDICSGKIMQSMSTNSAMLPMGGVGKKPTQAQIAQEQQVALESTSDVITILETSILNKLIRWFYELDYQFRTKDIHVRRFGPVGAQAEIQAIPPLGVDTHYTFKWYGTEGNKSSEQIQQMISLLNVMTGLPPEMLGGRRIDAGPIIEQAASATFGPRVAPKVLVDQAHQMKMDAHEENLMLSQNFEVQVRDQDDDSAHIKIHAIGAAETGDPTGSYQMHIQEHIAAKQKKMAQQAQNAPQQPLAPGGGGSSGPRPGAQVEAPTGLQNPPGAIHPDQQPLGPPRM